MSCTAIQPNPDISGIGVRTAMYAQAVLTLVQPILASLDGRVSEDELTGLHQLYIGILLPGCALLFSAIIQAQTFGLSVYHAIVVLNLSWINNTSALVFFQFALIAQMKLDKERDFRRKVGIMLVLLYKPLGSVRNELDTVKGREITKVAKDRAMRMKQALKYGLKNREDLTESREILEDVIQNLSALLGADDQELTDNINTTNRRLENSRLCRFLEMNSKSTAMDWVKNLVKRIPGGGTAIDLLERDWTMAALASAHLTLFAAVGVWLWFTIHHFGNCEPLTELTRLNIFVPIRVTAQPLRVIFIVIYIICLVPFLNIVILGGLEFCIVQLILNRRIDDFRNRKSPNPASFLASRGPSVLYSFIVLTFLVQAYFIITTELTIHNNRHLVQDSSQEDNWTFGQTLAVALIAIPLIQVWMELRKADNVKIFKGWFNSFLGKERRLEV